VARLIRLLFILAVGVVAGWPAAPRIVGSTRENGDGIPPAVVESYGHLTVLRLEGTPYEMGYQHGVARRAAIRQLLEDGVYGWAILGSGQSHAVLLTQARQLERGLPIEIQRELRGIADGAGLGYEDVLLLNLALNGLSSWASAPTDVLSAPATLDLEALGFAAWPPAIHQRDTLDSTLLGYRLDVTDQAARLRPHLLALIYRPAGGQSYATLTWSGQVGAWCGLNEANLAICATPARRGGISDQGLLPAVLTRQLLADAQDSEQALRQAIPHDYVAAFQLLIVDGRNQRATAIAFGAHRYDIVESGDGLLIFGQDQTQLTSILKRNFGWLNRDKALAALSIRSAFDEGAAGVCGESTLLNALFTPSRGELWVGLDLWPASCRRYLRLRLAG
jgi:hypothetical protein